MAQGGGLTTRRTMRTAAERRCEDLRLIRRHRCGDRRARETLIRRYLPLARTLALRYRHAPEPTDDLIQVASLALVKAVDRWDPDRGLAFATFAEPTILGEIRRYFRDLTWGVRPPRAVQELSLAVPRAHDQLAALLGREPTVAELAERLGRTAQEVAEALEAVEARSLRSLDAPGGDDEHEFATAGHMIASADSEYRRVEDRIMFERRISRLDRRAREILRLRFEQDLRQADIAERVGVSQMHVSRLIRKSIDQLRDELL
jgi:RNA polymerase sigma-B factor